MSDTPNTDALLEALLLEAWEQSPTIKSLVTRLREQERTIYVDNRLLSGALHLLNKHGLMPSRTELIAASDEAEREAAK